MLKQIIKLGKHSQGHWIGLSQRTTLKIGASLTFGGLAMYLEPSVQVKDNVVEHAGAVMRFLRYIQGCVN